MRQCHIITQSSRYQTTIHNYMCLQNCSYINITQTTKVLYIYSSPTSTQPTQCFLSYQFLLWHYMLVFCKDISAINPCTQISSEDFKISKTQHFISSYHTVSYFWGFKILWFGKLRWFCGLIISWDTYLNHLVIKPTFSNFL